MRQYEIKLLSADPGMDEKAKSELSQYGVQEINVFGAQVFFTASNTYDVGVLAAILQSAEIFVPGSLKLCAAEQLDTFVSYTVTVKSVASLEPAKAHLVPIQAFDPEVREAERIIVFVSDEPEASIRQILSGHPDVFEVDSLRVSEVTVAGGAGRDEIEAEIVVPAAPATLRRSSPEAETRGSPRLFSPAAPVIGSFGTQKIRELQRRAEEMSEFLKLDISSPAAAKEARLILKDAYIAKYYSFFPSDIEIEAELYYLQVVHRQKCLEEFFEKFIARDPDTTAEIIVGWIANNFNLFKTMAASLKGTAWEAVAEPMETMQDYARAASSDQLREQGLFVIDFPRLVAGLSVVEVAGLMTLLEIPDPFATPPGTPPGTPPASPSVDLRF